MGSDARAWEPEQLREFRAELLASPALADAVLARPDLFPPAPVEAERVITTSIENADLAICRALARAAEWRELWAIEMVR